MEYATLWIMSPLTQFCVCDSTYQLVSLVHNGSVDSVSFPSKSSLRWIKMVLCMESISPLRWFAIRERKHSYLFVSHYNSAVYSLMFLSHFELIDVIQRKKSLIRSLLPYFIEMINHASWKWLRIGLINAIQRAHFWSWELRLWCQSMNAQWAE